MQVALVIPAAGSGQRLGCGVPKALVDLGGKPLLARTLERVTSAFEFAEVVVLSPHPELERFEDTVAEFAAGGRRVRVLVGGSTRQESVAAGVAALDHSIELGCVHDAARPLVSAETVREVIAVAARCGAATVASRPSDSVREDRGSGDSFALDRARLWLVETPQVFRRELLARAHASAQREGRAYTDDASMVEALSERVTMVEGRGRNPKVTLPEDLVVAAALLARG